MSDLNPKPITAVGVSRTIIGLNYPWAYNKYGLYFGPHPKEPWMDKWIESFDNNLQAIKEMGVRLVRIFLLCNGENLGLIDPSDPLGQWMFKPASDPAYLIFRTHLKKMFNAARNNGFKIIPSLLDFGVGRPILRDQKRYRVVTDLRQTFLDRIVTPFVEVGKDFHDVLYAWEVMNEPSWLSARIWPWTGERGWSAVASESEINVFLRAVLERIKTVDPASKTTVGHRYYDDLKKYATGDIPQFHYYPSWHDDSSELPDVPSRILLGFENMPILGEIGTNSEHGGPWPGLRYRDSFGTYERVHERLSAVSRKGYEVVLLWPDEVWDGNEDVDNLKFSGDARRAIREFICAS